MCVATPYCNLSYPSKWGDQTRVSVEDGGSSCVVVFSACLEGKQEKELFRIHFNEDGQMPVGFFDTDNQRVYVLFSFADLSFSKDWTEEEKNRIYAMQEAANYLLDELAKTPGFTESE